MIKFLWEVYLTGFAIIFRTARVKDIGYKAGNSIVPLTVVQGLILIGISGYIEMFLGKKLSLSKPAVIMAFLALFFLNMYVLFIRGHGIKFAREFDMLKKSKRITLVVSCVMVAVAAIVLFIFSAIAYRRFLGIH